MSRVSCDYLIVGAGPAGTAAAISIKKLVPSSHVLLVDRQAFPRDKSCGDGLGPGVVRILAELDALDVLDGAPKPSHVLVGGPGGWQGQAEGPTVAGKDLSGFVLPREIFDYRLLLKAKSLGVEVWESTRFRTTYIEGSSRIAAFDREKEVVEVECKVLVGADGAYSRVRRELGVAKAEDRYTHVAIRAYGDVIWSAPTNFNNLPLRIDFEEQLLPAYGWVFPTNENRANVGVGIPVTLLERRTGNIQELMDQYVQGLSRRGLRVENLSLQAGHLLPHAAKIAPLVHDRAVLIGDAASMINPLSGEGIVYGMSAGLMLGKNLQRFPEGDHLSDFAKAFFRRYRLHFWSCWLSHRLLRSKRWARTVIKAAAKDQSVMDDAALLLFDEKVLRIRTGLRILLRGL